MEIIEEIGKYQESDMIIHSHSHSFIYSRKNNGTSDLHTCMHSQMNTEIKRNKDKWTNTEVQSSEIIFI